MNRKSLAFFLLSIIYAPIMAQQTCSIVARVTDEASRPLSGALVSVSSPALLGIRWVNSDQKGHFIVRSVPPGSYLMTISLDGYNSVKVRLELGLNTIARPNIQLKSQSVNEQMLVVETLNPLHDTPSLLQQFDHDFIEYMPVLNPDPTSIAKLSQGVSQGGPQRRLQISGAPSYENLYLLDGGVISRDNISGQASSLTLRDSIQEVAVLSGAISPEYGNLSGGVVNALSLSGSNTLEGLFRTSFLSDRWRALTPFEENAGNSSSTRNDEILSSHSFRLGGPIYKDRIWFFIAGQSFHDDRKGFLNASLTLAPSEAATLGVVDYGPGNLDRSYDRSMNDDRYEIKISAIPGPNQLFIASYTKRDYELVNNPGPGVMATSALIPKSKEPESLLSLHYQLLLSQYFILEMDYSSKKLGFKDQLENSEGNAATALVDVRTTYQFGAPAATHLQTERRDNHNFKAKVSYLFTTENGNHHDLVFGYEDRQDRNYNKSLSRPNGWQITGYSYYDENHQIHPVFGTTSNRSLISFMAYRFFNSETQANSFRTSSLFVNDAFNYGAHFKTSIGLRFDENDATGSDGLKISNKSSLSPRLWLEYDPFGTGNQRLRAGFARYTSRLANTAAGASTAGSESNLLWIYTGPVTTSVDQVFQWFQETYGDPRSESAIRGATLAQILDPANPQLVVDPNLHSPYSDEYHLSYNFARGKHFLFNVALIDRAYHDYYIEIRDLSTGRTPNGRFDQGVLSNDNGRYQRHYKALQSLFEYKPKESLSFGGNYTWSRLYGNLQSEADSGAVRTLSLTSYPEYNNFPDRAGILYLGGDRRHLGRVWMSYSRSLGFLKSNLSLIEELASGSVFQAAFQVPTTAAYGFSPNPGYLTPPARVLVALPDSSRTTTPGYSRTDLALNFDAPLSWGTFFTRFKLINLFNNDKQTYAINPNFGLRVLAPFNVYTEKPVEGVNFEYRPEFGTAQNRESFQDPREFILELGVKF